MDRENVEPVVQVFPEIALTDQFAQVLVRCGDDLGIDFDGLTASHPCKFALLKNSEKLGLEILSEGGDLIQEHDPIHRKFEFADHLLVRSGEGPLLVAEKFTLQQVRGNSRTVHSHEGSAASLAFGMYGSGDKFLTGPTLSCDKDIGIRMADPLNDTKYFLHSSGLPDNIAEAAQFYYFRSEVINLSLKPPFFQRLFHDLEYFRGIEGLGKVIESSVLDGLHTQAGAVSRGQHDNFGRVG